MFSPNGPLFAFSSTLMQSFPNLVYHGVIFGKMALAHCVDGKVCIFYGTTHTGAIFLDSAPIFPCANGGLKKTALARLLWPNNVAIIYYHDLAPLNSQLADFKKAERGITGITIL